MKYTKISGQVMKSTRMNREFIRGTFLSNWLAGIQFSISTLSIQQLDSFFLFSIAATALRNQPEMNGLTQKISWWLIHREFQASIKQKTIFQFIEQFLNKDN
jgi:hypothetical protein